MNVRITVADFLTTNRSAINSPLPAKSAASPLHMEHCHLCTYIRTYVHTYVRT